MPLAAAVMALDGQLVQKDLHFSANFKRELNTIPDREHVKSTLQLYTACNKNSEGRPPLYPLPCMVPSLTKYRKPSTLLKSLYKLSRLTKTTRANLTEPRSTPIVIPMESKNSTKTPNEHTFCVRKYENKLIRKE